MKKIHIFVQNKYKKVKKLLFSLITLLISAVTASAAIVAQHNFEGTLPKFIRVNGRGEISLSAEKFKDGNSSVRFSWSGPAQLIFSNSADIEASMKVKDAGIVLWIYNSSPFDDDLLFRFHDSNGGVICAQRFHMNFKGWRAMWVRYEDMLMPDGRHWGELPEEERAEVKASRMTVAVPVAVTQGTIYLDRLSFMTRPLIDQIAADMQIPDNNWKYSSRVWQWGRLWEWEQYPVPELKDITKEQANMLRSIEQRMDIWAATGNPGSQYTQSTLMPRCEEAWNTYGIKRLPDGSITGRPLLYDDEFSSADGDLRIRYIQDLVYWYALDYLYTGNCSNVSRVIDAMDHAIDQGFAYGSGWGTNKHYGYQMRNLYKGIWILRKELAKAGKLEEYNKVLLYWSGIQEARKPYALHRNDILDTWNTLLNPKVVSVMLQEDDRAKYAYMKLLGAWLSDSMLCSDGTIGGTKPDGTSFHHGGHYPSYSVGAFAAVGDFCFFTRDTDFAPAQEGRKALKKCMLAMQDYSNVRDWGIAVCGRHPLDGSIPEPDVQAFARLAVLGDLTGGGKAVDPELAGAYMALGGSDKAYLSEFKKAGVQAAKPAEGFRVYNYGGFGIHRRDGWMLSLKGFNSDVWSSEIYAKENRYGRYLSHGTAQLFTAPSRKESGYVREGWDWNRFPGATSIHLPFDMLDSPLPGTLMERNSSRFPGVSSLEGQNGCLAFTYVEGGRKNFCKGATATKSVFCFDNRIVHIGTGISNDSSYPTETTLYQLALVEKDEEVDVNDFYSSAFPLSHCVTEHGQVVLTDTKKNFYIIKDGVGLNVVKQLQKTPSDERKNDGEGNFITAYINHGVAPKEAHYEYMMLVQPSAKQVKESSKKLPYNVLQADNNAHVVKDIPTGITAYIVYSAFSGSAATLVASADAETIVMERKLADGSVVMSICTPDLGITEKAYTTPQASQPLLRSVVLNGSYKLLEPCDAVTLSQEGSGTRITATCQHGRPVEFKIINL